ncbi:MAG: hypothetical protein HEQ35_01915 [Gloeotrichia echinulata IR180]|nr:hypothetical protein [Gloeotrichia echinulata DEX184]
MKDNISLIAAAAGGFMLSVALSGILRGAPVTVWTGPSSLNSYSMVNVRIIKSLNS